jgi:hypothetical protein
MAYTYAEHPGFLCQIPPAFELKPGKAKILHEKEGGRMRVRFVFWLILAVSCSGVLIFAALYQAHVPAIMHVQIEPRPAAHIGFTDVQLRLTDPEGVPIENADVFSSAWMTNMVMQAPQGKVISLGQGTYVTELRLYMAGPWEIAVTAQADGFAPLKQTLFVQVR